MWVREATAQYSPVKFFGPLHEANDLTGEGSSNREPGCHHTKLVV